MFREQTNAIPFRNVIVQEVKVNPDSRTLEMMVDWELNEVMRFMRFQGQHDQLDPEVARRYFLTCCWMRCCTANRDLKHQYRQLTYDMEIPEHWYMFIDSLGESLDRAWNIKFIPVMDLSSDDLLTPQQMRDFSDDLAVLAASGYPTLQGMSREASGDLYVMSSLLISSPDEVKRICSYHKTHPVAAWFAAVLGLTPVREFTRIMDERMVEQYTRSCIQKAKYDANLTDGEEASPFEDDFVMADGSPGPKTKFRDMEDPTSSWHQLKALFRQVYASEDEALSNFMSDYKLFAKTPPEKPEFRKMAPQPPKKQSNEENSDPAPDTPTEEQGK